MNLFYRFESETAELEISYFRSNHVVGINGCYRNLSACYDEIGNSANSAAHDADFYLCSARASQTLHNVFFRHFYACYGCVVHHYDAVARKDAHFLRRAFAHGLYYEQGVLGHVKLNADAVERAFQRFVEPLHLLGSSVG